jgi:signal transduction histidine kinase
MWDWLEHWFGGGFMPHGHCYLWTPAMVWTQVASNTLIGLAYLSISAVLTYLVWRVKLPFSAVYVAFGVFILACGMTHFLDVATVWHPIYWADAGVRVVTAVASVGTAILLFPLLPKVLALAKLSGVAKERGQQLEASVLELTHANERLRREQEERARLAAENAALTERARFQEFQERFLSVLGHDLRNPLATVQMASGLLRKSLDEREGKVLGRIDSSTRRMARMIEQILDLTRSRLANGLDVRPSPFDLREVLTRVVGELRAANPSRTLVLRCEGPLHGSWDQPRLQQVFSTLIGNAVDHGRPEGPVTIEATSEASFVAISVHNEGPPIADETLALLFDPFRRGERDGRTARTAGLGLGLFVSREIVLAHRGVIEASSSVAEGTTFRVVLPRSMLASPPETERGAAE